MKGRRAITGVAVLMLGLAAIRAQTPPAGIPGATAQAQSDIPASMSPGAAEVIRLATSGVGDDVVLAYILNSQAPFNLTADDVLYLKDIGLSPQVTSAMLNHDSTLRTQSPQYAPTPAAPAASIPAAPAPAVATAPPAPAATAPPTYVSSPPPDVTYFYNDLSPYGTWVYLEGYGWCWQPTTVVISSGWRPYVDGGYWVYSDAGWFWQSTYSWGWAPFHYGRWYMHPRCGWVWFPDRVWGPAWVTWRTAGDSCGWAPLPPHAEFVANVGWRFNGVAVGVNFNFGLGADAYAFVSFGNVCARNLRPHCLPPAQVTKVYGQTTIINNYTVNNTTIVNHGVPVARVSAASHIAVPRATIRNLPAGAHGPAVHSGSVVYRHDLATPTRSANMVAEKVDPRHQVIQHSPTSPSRMERSVPNRGNAPAARGDTRRSASETWGNMQTARNRSYVAAPSSAGSTANTAATQRSSVERNPHVYYPKGYYQAQDIRSWSRPDQQRDQSFKSPGNSSDSRGRKNR